VVIGLVIIGQSLLHKHDSKNKPADNRHSKNTPKKDPIMQFDNTPSNTPTTSPRKSKSTLESLENVERYAFYKGKIP